MSDTTQLPWYRQLWYIRRNGYSGPFFVALMLFLMGVWLLVSGDSFARGDVYRVAGDVATELGWGVFLLVSCSVLVVGSLARHPREVALGGLMASGAFGLLFVSYLAADPGSLQVPMTFVMSLRGLSLYREFTARQNDPHLVGPPDHRWTYPEKER